MYIPKKIIFVGITLVLSLDFWLNLEKVDALARSGLRYSPFKLNLVLVDFWPVVFVFADVGTV